LIAQEVQKVLPEIVHEEDGFLAVSYVELIPILIEAIKEIVQSYDAQHDNIKKEIEMLNRRLDSIPIQIVYPERIAIKESYVFKIPNYFLCGLLFLFVLGHCALLSGSILLGSSLDLDTHIKVTLLKATGLKEMNLDTPPNPYVEIRIACDYLKSQVKYGTYDPVFNQQFNQIAHPSDDISTITFQLYDYSTNPYFADRRMGYAEVITTNLVSDDPSTVWLTLQPNIPEDSMKGQLEVEIEFKRPTDYSGYVVLIIFGFICIVVSVVFSMHFWRKKKSKYIHF